MGKKKLPQHRKSRGKTGIGEESGKNRETKLLVAVLMVLAVSFFVVFIVSIRYPENKPSFSLYSLKDAEFSEFRGKVVLVDCFATWCDPCKIEVGQLVKIRSRYSKSKVVLVSVASKSDDVDEIEAFMEEFGVTWKVARDNVGVFDKYDIIYIPTILIFDREGVLVYKHVGLTPASVLSSEIDSLLDS